jgi:hypothetical protein
MNSYYPPPERYSKADRGAMYSVEEYYMTELEASPIVTLTICYHVIQCDYSVIDIS